MPHYYEKEDVESGVSCKGLREDLRECLLATDCVRIHKKSPKECLLSQDASIPERCYVLRNGFFECKRSLLDTRQRFRGRRGY
ncbi:cytochrome c oxidase assembly factor 5 [Centruroides vittatus]|uniref:cytochrome c oxidase assembly factor 5 n=1 Tax=Centruroides vittatus TaxID=120091 RepID=UPI00350F4E67